MVWPVYSDSQMNESLEILIYFQQIKQEKHNQCDLLPKWMTLMNWFFFVNLIKIWYKINYVYEILLNIENVSLPIVIWTADLFLHISQYNSSCKLQVFDSLKMAHKE